MENVDGIIAKYVTAATAHGEGTEEGNYKIVNKEYKKLTNIYRKFEIELDVAEQILEKLLSYPNDYVRLWAASHALGLNLYVQQSVEALEDISKKSKLLGFNAEMTLKVWREKGKLTF